jgi:RND family efflux transporter MFP subunit
MSIFLQTSRLRKLFIALGLGLLMVLAGCDKKTEKPAVIPSVTVAKPLSQEVRAYELFDGNVQAYLSVDLNARVPGYLTQIKFQDGGYVKKDQLLFVIEQDQYQQQVNLTQAVYNQAKIELDRQKNLLKENATSQAAVDNATSSYLQAEANFKLAKINLGYTEIRAPFDGLMGRHLIDVGNYLGSNPNGVKLATIQKIMPVYVYFSINERDLLKFRKENLSDNKNKDMVNTLPVAVALQEDIGFPHTGVLDFAANELNTNTGSLQLRAELKNSELTLLPGLYAKVMVQYGKPHQAMLIPSATLQTDQQGYYVYVMDDNKKVSRQNVTLGQKYGKLIEILTGLQTNQDVVINGFVSISQGQTVNPKTITIEPLPKQ